MLLHISIKSINYKKKRLYVIIAIYRLKPKLLMKYESKLYKKNPLILGAMPPTTSIKGLSAAHWGVGLLCLPVAREYESHSNKNSKTIFFLLFC